MSTISYDSDVSEADDLSASMTSVGSSLIVPRVGIEKRVCPKANPSSLEHIRKTSRQKSEDHSASKQSGNYSEDSDINEWWLEQIASNLNKKMQ